MIYDGDCGFCKYWLVKWKKVSGEIFDFEPYQSAAERFKDIPKIEFQKAVQLILTNGEVYSGAKAAYYTYSVNGKLPVLFKAYENLGAFRFLSDGLYKLIARNRNAAFTLTKLIFGKDPERNSSFRVFLLLILTIALISYSIFAL